MPPSWVMLPTSDSSSASSTDAAATATAAVSGSASSSEDTAPTETGTDGIRLAQEVDPDLILMDINLPEMDGYEATARLKKIDKLSGVPIIAMTANVMKGDREKTLEAGCDGYIQKPIDVDQLPEQIEKFLAAKG